MKRRQKRVWFEIRPGQHRPKHARNGLVFVILAGLFLYVIYTKPGVPFMGDDTTMVSMDVSDGVNLRPGRTPVRVQGVEIGQVSDVQRAPSGKGIRVELKVDNKMNVVVRRDARAAVRWRTLLGRNVYVDLDPGSLSAPVLGDAVIPIARTEVQTELDAAIEPLDADGRKSSKTIVQEFDRGFRSPNSFRAAVDSLEPAMRSVGPGLRSLRGANDGDLQRLIRSTSRVAGAFSRDERALAQLISSGRSALGVTAARQADLRSLLGAAPQALDETRRTMARLRTTLDVLDPVAADLRPGARKLKGSAIKAQRLLSAAVPLLRDTSKTIGVLEPAVGELPRLTSSGQDVIKAVNPILDRIAYPIVPWLHQRGASKRKNFQMVGPNIGSFASALSWGDRYGSVGTFEAGAGETSVGLSPCKTFLVNDLIDPANKVQCELVSRIIAGLVTGVAPTDVEPSMANSATKTVDSLLKDGNKMRSVLRGHTAVTKGGGR